MKNRVSKHPFKNKLPITLYFLFTLSSFLSAQGFEPEKDAAFIDKIYDQSLTDGRCYAWLEHLATKIGNRLSGSANAEKAVNWSRATLDTLGLDSVWLQPCMVPHWVRGAAEDEGAA